MSSSQNKKRPRKTGILVTKDVNIYIFCEGEQTEPIYFKGFKKAIEKSGIYRNILTVEVEGLGTDTIRVISAAEKYVKDKGISKAQIWCVYDLDSFPKQSFNAVSEKASALNKERENIKNGIEFKVAWSNQCIEYWFILHFEYYIADNSRKDYKEFLNRKFKENGFTGYTKTHEDLFEIMLSANPKQAIKWAKQRIKELIGTADADMAPATKVYLLVEELSAYLPEDMKSKFI